MTGVNQVQDIMQRLGLPAEDDMVMDPNQAAIALAMAMNQARMELADREGVKSEARTFAAARLEALRKKLAPLYAAIPRDVEMFDLGLVAQEKPRLFVDIIAFIEMNRDQTGYRFLQETRAGRVTLAESGDDKVIFDHVTQYVARRLVERERALAEDGHFGLPAPAEPSKGPLAEATPEKPVLPDMPRATSTVPMTAAEAFRQWTRPVQDTAPAPAIADAVTSTLAPVADNAREIAARLSSEQLPSPPAAVHPVMTVGAAPLESARGTVETLAHALAETKKPEAQIAPASSLTNAAMMTAAVATAAGAKAVRTPPVPTVHRSTSGWWLWPLLAMLIGIGLGALALYLYAASLVR
jgi:hypothetical protein